MKKSKYIFFQILKLVGCVIIFGIVLFVDAYIFLADKHQNTTAFVINLIGTALSSYFLMESLLKAASKEYREEKNHRKEIRKSVKISSKNMASDNEPVKVKLYGNNQSLDTSHFIRHNL